MYNINFSCPRQSLIDKNINKFLSSLNGINCGNELIARSSTKNENPIEQLNKYRNKD